MEGFTFPTRLEISILRQQCIAGAGTISVWYSCFTTWGCEAEAVTRPSSNGYLTVPHRSMIAITKAGYWNEPQWEGLEVHPSHAHWQKWVLSLVHDSTVMPPPLWTPDLILGIILSKYQESGGWQSPEARITKRAVSLLHAALIYWPYSKLWWSKPCQRLRLRL